VGGRCEAALGSTCASGHRRPSDRGLSRVLEDAVHVDLGTSDLDHQQAARVIIIGRIGVGAERSCVPLGEGGG
jgi:hypothetical protein